jgi:hypothetical protein
MEMRRERPVEKSTVALALEPPEPAPSMAMSFMFWLWPLASIFTFFAE